MLNLLTIPLNKLGSERLIKCSERDLASIERLPQLPGRLQSRPLWSCFYERKEGKHAPPVGYQLLIDRAHAVPKICMLQEITAHVGLSL